MRARRWAIGAVAFFALLSLRAEAQPASLSPPQTAADASLSCADLPRGTRAAGQVRVEIQSDCQARTIAITASGQDGQAVGWSLIAIDLQICSSPKIRALMRQGWKASLRAIAPGAKADPFAVDCSDVDAMLTDKNPPPPGTPEAVAAGIASPPEPSVRPVVDVYLEEPLDEAARRSTYKLPSKDFMVLVTEKADLIYRHAGEIRFDRVGDCSDCSFEISIDSNNKIDGVVFNYQDRPLKLAEAMERSHTLYDSLLSHGFAESQGAATSNGPFHIDDRQQNETLHPRNWTEAEAALGDEKSNIKQMHLFSMVAPDATVTVRLVNWRRQARDFGLEGRSTTTDPSPFAGQTVFDGNGGYEWGLEVNISRPQ